jgi:hypothetical protein
VAINFFVSHQKKLSNFFSTVIVEMRREMVGQSMAIDLMSIFGPLDRFSLLSLNLIGVLQAEGNLICKKSIDKGAFSPLTFCCIIQQPHGKKTRARAQSSGLTEL